MNRILCLAFVMSALASPALAGMSEGVAAITVGDYPRAISEFEPLAASGDAAAQYQLAKLYLEGHGPADGVARGVELMTKSAKSNHPEAQAQLGLMYAMGLGVPVDNAQAYQWLTKAVDALPDGTRRAVAQANRDAVQKRMKPDQANVVASAPASAAPAAKPATTQAAATKTAPTPPPAPAKPATVEAAPTKPAKVEPKPAETAAAAKTTEAAPAKPAVVEAAKPATPAKPASEPVEVAAAKPATTEAAAKPAATQSTPPAATVTEASNVKPAKAPDTSTQVASAKAPEPESAAPKASGPASADAVQSGVRIQIASLPSEELAWSEWKRLSGQFSAQLSGLTAIVKAADLGEQGTFYRIQTGPFDTIAAAEQRCTAMKEAGLSCLVVGAQ